MAQRFDQGTDQNLGISGPKNQEDAVRIENIHTASKLELTVAAVADGGAAVTQNGQAASKALRYLWQSLKNGSSSDVSQVLKKAFQDTERMLREDAQGGQPAVVAMTVAAIHDKRLYLVHTGHTRAYLVNSKQVKLLTQDHLSHSGQLTRALGLQEYTEPDMIPSAGSGQNVPSILLNKGDHLLLCSDGLVRERPDRPGEKLVSDDEIKRVLNDANTPALEAARTLVSLAVGRRASDNVSAAVISMPSAGRTSWLLLLLPVLVLAVVALFALFSAIGGDDPQPTSTIAPTFTAAPPTVTATPSPTPVSVNARVIRPVAQVLQEGQEWQPFTANNLTEGDSIRTDANGLFQFIFTGGTSVYLASETQVLFQADNFLQLAQGNLLVVNEQPVSTASFTIEVNGDSAVLPQGGSMAVSSTGERTILACFAGDCQLNNAQIPVGKQGGPGQAPIPIEAEDLAGWQALCPTCKLVP